MDSVNSPDNENKDFDKNVTETTTSPAGLKAVVESGKPSTVVEVCMALKALQQLNPKSLKGDKQQQALFALERRGFRHKFVGPLSVLRKSFTKYDVDKYVDILTANTELMDEMLENLSFFKGDRRVRTVAKLNPATVKEFEASLFINTEGLALLHYAGLLRLATYKDTVEAVMKIIKGELECDDMISTTVIDHKPYYDAWNLAKACGRRGRLDLVSQTVERRLRQPALIVNERRLITPEAGAHNPRTHDTPALF